MPEFYDWMTNKPADEDPDLANLYVPALDTVTGDMKRVQASKIGTGGVPGAGGGDLKVWPLICSDRVTPISAVAANVYSDHLPFDIILNEVTGSLVKACGTGTFEFDVLIGGVSVFSTQPTFDATEKKTTSAAVPPVLDSTEFSRGDEVVVAITNVGDGTAQGLIVNLVYGTEPVPDLEAPTDVSDLNATPDGHEEADLTWTPASDNIAVTGYQLQRATNNTFTAGLVTTNIPAGSSYHVAGLNPSTQYYWRIKARDAAANFSDNWSNTANATTGAAPIEPTDNWALASNGASASASSTLSGFGWSPADAIDGLRHTNNDFANNAWRANAMPSVGTPQWLEVDLGTTRQVNRIIVWGVHPTRTYNTAPSPSSTFTSADTGLKDFKLQYWNGSAWVDVATAVDNDLVVYQADFAMVSTTKVRILITEAEAFTNECMVVELEAWGIV